MNIDIGQLRSSQIVIFAGILVIIFGALVWYARGPIKIKVLSAGTVTLPSSAGAGQFIVIFGALMLAGGLFSTALLSGSASPPTRPDGPAGAIPASSAQATPSAKPGAHPVTSPPPPAVAASVSMVAAGGGTSLGRDVIAIGNVGVTGYACYAVGWYVVTASNWTGYFVKTLVTADSHGTFRTQVLQMGSPSETGSAWQPLLLGATPAGCSWLRQLWARTPTGEYHDTWPPSGITVLYQATHPIHRTT